jgi:glycosyltransferase involved in cell wall biosynthesis
MSSNLTWSLALATYNRLEMLKRCIPLCLAQTYPPLEIVIVDSSENWSENKNAILEAFSGNEKNIPIKYLQAKIRSSSTQRNQAVNESSGDVLFLIDDDSLMYPNCAEEIMKVYQADSRNEIVGVAAVHNTVPPDSKDPEAAQEIKIGAKGQTGLTKYLRQLLRADHINIPHDGQWPNVYVPDSLSHLNVRPNKGVAGCFMTVRRESAIEEPFETLLRRYAAGEDMDASNRWQRKGCILRALDAQLHHVASPSARLGLYYISAIGGLNRIVLNKLHGTTPEVSLKQLKNMYARLLIINALKDIRGLNLSFPRTRGIFYAASNLKKIYSMDEDSLRNWYTKIQDELAEKYA